MKERILMILPAYNEEDNILKAYNKICEYNNAHKTNYDVIVINDCSTDNTLKICLENKIPVIAFALSEEDSIVKAVNGEKIGTIIQ